ncbi:MAG TPA: DUF2931 family protein [Panacibacter sp.]|nr:DUF2931 family protein [Panacibacter sp.]
MKYIYIFYAIFCFTRCSVNNNSTDTDNTNNNKMNPTTYEWIPTECAVFNYPMKIIKADFIFEDGNTIKIPDSKMIYNGWGKTGSIHLNEEVLIPIPAKLYIKWFSYTEDKFFEETFNLPKDKMISLFNEGFISPLTNSKYTYNKIIVGLAPGGTVVVWLSGDNINKQVAIFQAKIANVEWSTFLPSTDITRKEYIDESLKQIFEKEDFETLKKNGIPIGLWNKKYVTKSLWQPVIVTTNNPSNIFISYFNAESEYSDLSKKNVMEAKERPYPKKAIVEWETNSKNKYHAEINFSEDEIYSAFNKLIENKENATIKLQFLINDAVNSLTVALSNDSNIINLKKCIIDINEF